MPTSAISAPPLPTHGEQEESATAGLVALSSARSLNLLASQEVGRVVYTDGGLPAVTPVNYAYDQGHVFVRTSKFSHLVRKVPGTIVAFEVDDVDRKARSGWSVVVTGPCEIVKDSYTKSRLTKLGLEPWAGGDRNVVLQIAATIVTGYRIAPHDKAEPGV